MFVTYLLPPPSSLLYLHIVHFVHFANMLTSSRERYATTTRAAANARTLKAPMATLTHCASADCSLSIIARAAWRTWVECFVIGTPPLESDAVGAARTTRKMQEWRSQLKNPLEDMLWQHIQFCWQRNCFTKLQPTLQAATAMTATSSANSADDSIVPHIIAFATRLATHR